MTHSKGSVDPAAIAPAFAWLRTFTDWEQSLTADASRTFDLVRITRLLSNLGNPERGRPQIHVTGTKGKGSVVFFADGILRAHGVRTFRFISPHVEKLNERIAIDGEDVTDERLAGTIDMLRPAILEQADDPPTFFEIMTAIGFTLARQSGAEVDVVEVGLGGRLDATNVIDPTVSVITSIGLDHTKILGRTREKIAAEKAGIIKRGRPVLTGLVPADPGFDVIAARARDLGAALSHPGKGIAVSGAQYAMTSLGRPGVRFDGAIGGLSVNGALAPGGGLHQAGNAILALAAAARALEATGRQLDPSLALRALEATGMPARAEPFATRVPVLLDGAHTGQSARALVDLARWFFPGRRVVLLAGLTRDRSARSLFSPFRKLADQAIFTAIRSPRSADPAAALEAWRALGGAGEVANGALEALERSFAAAGKGGAVVAAGSFYLAGELRPVLRTQAQEVSSGP